MKHRKRPGQGQETRSAIKFLLPNIIGFGLFTAWPVIAAALLSFCAWDLLSDPVWVGGANFIELLGVRRDVTGAWVANDPDFWKYLWNTVFLMFNLPMVMMGSLFLAIILNKRINFSYLYRLIFYLPHIVSGVAIYYLWTWMYDPEFGLVNVVLGAVGIEGPNWLTDYHWAKPALMLMGLWLGVGGTSMILYLAALQGVPQELYEAAEIDGAGAWATFWAITWPSVMPVTFFILTMGMINGFQAGVEMAYIMTGGGPFGATTTIGFYIYDMAFESFRMGYASAIAWVLFMIVLSITLINWKRGGRQLGA